MGVTLFHLTGVALALLVAASSAHAQTPAEPGNTQFLVFLQSQPIGREEVAVLNVADGWVVRGSSRLGQPIDITSRVAEVSYDLEWRPRSLTVEGVVRGQDVSLKTTFSGGTAANVSAAARATQAGSP